MAKPSYATLAADRESYATRIAILELALTHQPDAIYRFRDGRDVYTWKAYRLAGPAGGFVICVFTGFTNGRPHVTDVAGLDTLADTARNYTSSSNYGMTEAVGRFTSVRHTLTSDGGR